MNGVLVIDKPEGPTSHDVVVRVRRATGVTRIGHTGTLDPIASGVLVLVLGQAARLAQFLGNTEKEYEATIKLGLETDTYDVTGRRIRHGEGSELVEQLTRLHIEEVLQKFRGSYWQDPPPFSAKKIGGTRAYKLARRGAPVQPPAAPVSVSRLDLADFQRDQLTLRVTCSPGFYIRSLAHDVGRQLGTGACLQRLRRLRSGEFALDRALSLEAVEQNPAVARDCLMPMSGLLHSLPGLILTTDGARRAARGNVIGRDHLAQPVGPWAARVRLLDPEGQLIAIAEPAKEPGLLHPAVVVV